jgi:arabinogalactan oligomer / maltooligosaccharide transport system substrate-binding protein
VKHRRGALALVAITSLFAAACGDDEASPAATSGSSGATTTAGEAAETTAVTETTAPAASGDTTTTVFAAPDRGDADLVVWADDTRTPVLTPIAEKFAAEEGINVKVLEVPFDNIRDNLSVSGAAGEGPDIVIGAHDWLGELVADGAVTPIDLGAAASGFSPVAVQAMTYEGKVYGLPYAVENIALIRNTDLVPTAPATFEELETTALQLVADGKADIPLAVQQDTADPYHNFPLFSAAGGYVFKQNPDGTYDPTDVGIDSEGGLKAAELFGKWSSEGLISKDVTFDVMNESFSSGKAPFAMTGPWAIEGFTEAGVNFAVEPIPPVDGGTAKVFVGVQGFMISSFSKNQDLAKTFVLDYLATEQVQLDLFEAGGRPPALISAFDKVSTDPIVQGFGVAGQQGQPLPAIPEMSAVWDAWIDAYTLVFTGSEPRQAFTDAAATIREKIAEG